MHRKLKYIAFASTSIFSCALMYKTGGDYVKFGTLHAAADGRNPEVLRSGPASEIQNWNKNWDFREPKLEGRLGAPPDEGNVPSFAQLSGVDKHKASVGKHGATRHLLFIRHGQYAKADEDEKKVLTTFGRKQAEVTANRLKRLHAEKKIDKIVISSMVRAKETGDIILKQLSGVPYEYCDFLIEGAPCKSEPPSSTYKPESQEIFQDSARIETAFRKYIHRAEPEQKNNSIEVYVCHANVIRYFVCRALQFPTEGWLRMSIGHCGITWLTIKPNGYVSLRSLGDTGHLYPDLITHN